MHTWKYIIVTMKVYYKDRDTLNQIEEPYKSALAILEELYVQVPDGKTCLDYKQFPDFMAINDVRQICDNVKANPIPYISIISRSRDLLYQPGLPRQNKFEEGFRVCYPYEATTIIGGVYYVLAVDGTLNERQLESVEKVATWGLKSELRPYFNVFKNEVNNHKVQESPKEEKKDVKGFTPAQSCLFLEGLLSHLKVSYTNKKDFIPPIVEKTFGWKVSTCEKRVTEGYSQEDRLTVSNTYKDTPLETIFMNIGKCNVDVETLQQKGESTKQIR